MRPGAGTWPAALMVMSCASATFLSAILFVGTFASAATPAKFTASAYSIEGKAANGSKSCKGTVSADPAVLPLGSKIRVRGAGLYSGVYTVIDTGQKVKGRVIDIFVSSVREAVEFGKKQVEVELLAATRRRSK